MCWRAHPVYDTDREFRFYWLRTKLSECKGINEISRINPYKFVALDSFSSSKDSLAALLSKPWPLEVDGLLFFHKLGHYLSRQSPLVVWLKPHMVTDILGVPVSDEFLACAPRMSDPLATPTRKGRGQERDKGSDGPTSQLEAGHNTTTIEMDSELSTQS
jgi:snurportin-1